MSTVLVTGANGLLGWQASAAIHADACMARFEGREPRNALRRAGSAEFADLETLTGLVEDCDTVLHFAGLNRAPSDQAVEEGNPAIAGILIEALNRAQSCPHVVYANTIHADKDTPYGRSKAKAASMLEAWADDTGGGFTDLILPHIFGEGARPNYNNVTATFCQAVVEGTRPEVNPDGRVELLHAGEAVALALELAGFDAPVRVRAEGRVMGVPALLERLETQWADYQSHIYPDLQDPFDLALFNTLRFHAYPTHFPVTVPVKSDMRGRLFEVAKGGGGGQSFVSWTEPGVTRGDHFHRRKVERFLVLEGEAVIQMRRVLRPDHMTFRVSGDQPAYVDMPTLWTHNITNVGDRPLVTAFWSQEIFDPQDPDTFADPVTHHGEG